MNWKFHTPRFAADDSPELPASFIAGGAWSGHRRFAYDLVRFTRPRTIVELGTLYGTSYFSFCQAVKDAKLDTSCFAVDTWQGDAHTGQYGLADDTMYQAVNSVNAREFADIGTLLRSTFDEALAAFPNGSINILHIDGYHAYQAVLHDYLTWLPKLADNGIVLFHDTVVRLPDFGVYLLWGQLQSMPHLHFEHSNGLGVLFPKGCPEPFQAVLQQQEKLAAHYRSQE
ncbi:Methyltransferase domain-containing protein [Paenibacillus algorifonticola]|uniref:Methyltransferase domain-containing protein n=1 Tax=Paenibacillus algorifonticola TaxID=684063 RepID=A0A1I1Y8I3_9BACL|nr:class I SAM-dependent methyltransferase [Paenibacillus algorifonticola]SFE15308.1 Methyltransferase domain-containing protein [Paenibacillus algorifonticola]